MSKGGTIINTSSIQAFDPSPGLLAYAPTKAAIVNFSKALAKKAIEHGVRVNAVAPGPVWTPLIPATLKQDHVKKFGQNTSFGRMAQPKELAPLFVFAASEESSYCTGEVFGATGGRSPV
jgi:NAD(P)-dependent dehydrogenase (short-subunit alcohol dehydrogenase family)